jgi:hypothetical protein
MIHFNCVIHITICKHNTRTFSTKFQSDVLQITSTSGFLNYFPYLCSVDINVLVVFILIVFGSYCKIK